MVGGELQVKAPTLTYKIAFLAGGAGFAVSTYLIGTWLYGAEVELRKGLPLSFDPVGMVVDILSSHLITLIPWVVGTTGLSIALGYLFDKQVKYRLKAEELQRRAELLAVVDGLTQVYNHSYFLEHLGIEIKRTQRQVGNVALIMLDLDNFKKYNDSNGHLLGDEVLKRVGRTLRATVRETDIVARYGGEEFVIVAPGSDREQALVLAERVRSNIAMTCPATVSVGVAAYPDDADAVECLIQRADEALYLAKRTGKNCVRSAGDPALAQK